jgi:hypothetical protein
VGIYGLIQVIPYQPENTSLLMMHQKPIYGLSGQFDEKIEQQILVPFQVVKYEGIGF